MKQKGHTTVATEKGVINYKMPTISSKPTLLKIRPLEMGLNNHNFEKVSSEKAQNRLATLIPSPCRLHITMNGLKILQNYC